MNIQTANALFDEGTFSAMYKAGFITTKVFIYREIYLWIQAQIKTRNLSKRQAVLEAEVKFKKDERTIWRALNSFEDN
jgi:ribosomal protein S3